MDSEKLIMVLAFDVDKYLNFHERECYILPDERARERSEASAKAVDKWEAYLKENGLTASNEAPPADPDPPKIEAIEADMYLQRYDFDFMRLQIGRFLEVDINEAKARFENGIIPVDMVCSQEISQALENVDSRFLECFTKELPIMAKHDMQFGLTELSYFFALVKFIQWLDLQRQSNDPADLEPVEAGHYARPVLIEWNAPKSALYYLLRALKNTYGKDGKPLISGSYDDLAAMVKNSFAGFQGSISTIRGELEKVQTPVAKHRQPIDQILRDTESEALKIE